MVFSGTVCGTNNLADSFCFFPLVLDFSFLTIHTTRIILFIQKHIYKKNTEGQDQMHSGWYGHSQRKTNTI